MKLGPSFRYRHTFRCLSAVALLASLGLMAKAAHAQDIPPPVPVAEPEVETPVDTDRPWTKGVSATDQKKALSIFNTGNTFFETSQYSQALVRYREALKSWSHPAIHFNMMVCLINLDQPKEAYQHLGAALKFGAAPLGKDVYQRALTYEKVLNKAVTSLTIKSSQEGVDISLDGKAVLSSPGETTIVALPGNHQLVASKDGYLTHTEILNLIGGEKTVSEVKLIPLAEAQTFRLERRWARWKPWTTLGVGAVTLAAGFGTRLLASSDFDQYDNDVTNFCPEQGCTSEELPQSSKDTLARAELEDTVSSALLIGGAATVGAGAILLYLNRERSIKEMLPTITPMVTPRGAGVSLSIDFN